MRLIILPAVGLEPTRGYPQQILSLHRLPFRHAGVFLCACTDVQLYYYIIEKMYNQEADSLFAVKILFNLILKQVIRQHMQSLFEVTAVDSRQEFGFAECDYI